MNCLGMKCPNCGNQLDTGGNCWNENCRHQPTQPSEAGEKRRDMANCSCWPGAKNQNCQVHAPPQSPDPGGEIEPIHVALTYLRDHIQSQAAEIERLKRDVDLIAHGALSYQRQMNEAEAERDALLDGMREIELYLSQGDVGGAREIIRKSIANRHLKENQNV